MNTLAPQRPFQPLSPDAARVISCLHSGPRTKQKSEEPDQDNALKGRPEHGLPGAQLGPNQGGKTW